MRFYITPTIIYDLLELTGVEPTRDSFIFKRGPYEVEVSNVWVFGSEEALFSGLAMRFYEECKKGKHKHPFEEYYWENIMNVVKLVDDPLDPYKKPYFTIESAIEYLQSNDKWFYEYEEAKEAERKNRRRIGRT